MTRKEFRKRMQAYIHCSAEELMLQRYEEQKKHAFTISTPIERNAFEIGKGTKQPKKAKNKFSKEEFGTCGTYIATKRFPNSRLTCVCKSRNMY